MAGEKRDPKVEDVGLNLCQTFNQDWLYSSFCLMIMPMSSDKHADLPQAEFVSQDMEHEQ